MQLKYGNEEVLDFDVPAERVAAHFEAPAAHPDLASEIARAMGGPLEFPPLSKSVLADDLVAIAIDDTVSDPAPIFASLWQQLSTAGVPPENVHVIQPAPRRHFQPADPRAELPSDIRDRVARTIHDPDDEEACAYLASAASGERVYVANPLVQADFVVTVGQINFDPLMGYRGTHSVFFPGMSNADAKERARGQGHRELGPDDERPLRQLVDEIGWLIGTQFSVQTIPAAGGVSRVLAGSAETVLQAGKSLLNRHWTCTLEERPEIVVAAISSGPFDDDWLQLGAAIRTARNLVAYGGKVLILSDVCDEPGVGVELVRDSREATDAIQPLRSIAPADLVTATQLALGVDWANIYLLSRLKSDLVEDLFMVPVENQREALRVIQGDDPIAFLESANFLHATISD